MSDRAAASGPLKYIEAITPNDTTDFYPSRAIYIETTGPVALIPEGGDASITIPGLVGGVWHPICCTRILDTGTTATTVYIGR